MIDKCFLALDPRSGIEDGGENAGIEGALREIVGFEGLSAPKYDASVLDILRCSCGNDDLR